MPRESYFFLISITMRVFLIWFLLKTGISILSGVGGVKIPWNKNVIADVLLIGWARQLAVKNR